MPKNKREYYVTSNAHVFRMENKRIVVFHNQKEKENPQNIVIEVTNFRGKENIADTIKRGKEPASAFSDIIHKGSTVVDALYLKEETAYILMQLLMNHFNNQPEKNKVFVIEKNDQ